MRNKEIQIGEIKKKEGVIYIKNRKSLTFLFKYRNPNVRYNGDYDAYTNFHRKFISIIKQTGEDFVIQKTDYINEKFYETIEDLDNIDYLNKKYHEHFHGRPYKGIDTFISITRKDYNRTRVDEDTTSGELYFISLMRDILEYFHEDEVEVFKDKDVVKNTILNFFNLNPLDSVVRYKNIKKHVASPANNYNYLQVDDKFINTISVLNNEVISLPNYFTPYLEVGDLGSPNYPVHPFTFLWDIEGDVIYNQIISIKQQRDEITKLEAKQKKHKGIPDPSNILAVQDIDEALNDIVETNEVIVDCQFTITAICNKVSVLTETRSTILRSIADALNIDGLQNKNQIELFYNLLINGFQFKDYDLFKQSRSAAVCLFFNEGLEMNTDSYYRIYFANNSGIPIALDTSEYPMSKQIISNRNRFVLGPSGTGKSFYTNSYLLQCATQDEGAEIVVIDTGDSYLGTSNYLNGAYITWSDDKPITMNPFKISEEEYNEEKKQAMISLIALLWKGADGHITRVEDSVLSQVISKYFDLYFIGEIEANFNSFYEFSITEIDKIINEDKITFNLPEYKFILKTFYKGGQYDQLLNKDADSSLFDEPFIVFEIDNIKDHPLLFPIVTIIIMDVFLQKMRMKGAKKKILVVEEAWKALMSPMMANYILYLYKTVRKFAGEAIVVTQELDDILKSEIVKDSILANSDTLFLLDQRKLEHKYDVYQEVLGITDTERRKLFTVNNLPKQPYRGMYRSVFIKMGNTSGVYDIEVPLEQYLTFTTEKRERILLEAYLKDYGNYQKAIDSFVNDFKQSGMSLLNFVNSKNKEYEKIA